MISSSLLAALDGARARFRQDVADQLRMAAEKAGATVTLDHERAMLDFDGTLDGASPRVVAAFGDEREGKPGGSDRITLCVDTGDEQTTLLTLAWRDDDAPYEEAALERRLAELEACTDESVPLKLRGLNAPVDERTTGSDEDLSAHHT
jgi:hypothetical protein